MTPQLIRSIKRLRVFLRQSDSKSFDPVTRQRNDVYFDSCNGKPSVKELAQDNLSSKFEVKNISIHDNNSGQDNSYSVEWKDGHESHFNADWVKSHINRLETSVSEKVPELSPIIPRIPWSNLAEDEVRCSTSNNRMAVPFREIIHQSEKTEEALRILYQYGILLVTSTPISDDGAGIAALASALSGPAYKSETTLLAHYTEADDAAVPRRTILENGTDGPQKTLYGNIWSTHSSQMAVGTSTADTAYGTDALPLHTDMGYYRDPPGLQIFTMCSPADEGGESIFSDGLAVAEYMRKHHEREFDVLCRTVRRYRSIDEEMGWHLEGSGPVFKAVDRFEGNPAAFSTMNHEARWGPVLGVRHNDLDRLPDLPPPNMIGDEKSVNDFYDDLAQAHKILDMLLSKDEFRLVMKVKSGETVVVANQVRGEDETIARPAEKS